MPNYKLPSGQIISDKDPNLQEFITQGAVLDTPTQPAPPTPTNATPDTQKYFGMTGAEFQTAQQPPPPAQQATLTSPTGEKRVVDVGSQEASDLLRNQWTLGDKIGGGTVLNVDNLKAAPDIDMGDGAPEPTSTDADTFVGGLTEFQKQTAENLKNAQAPETEKSQTLEELIKSVMGDVGEATSKEAMQAQAEAEMGITDIDKTRAQKSTELKVKLAEIDALTKSYQEGATKIEGLNILTSGIAGKKGQLYREYLARKNSLSSEAGIIQAELLGLQGELTAAQNAADRAVNLKYADQEFDINTKLSLINILQPQVDKEEKEYADAYALTLQQQADALADLKQTEKDILNVKIDAINAGITDPNILTQIGQAGSVDEALQIMGTNIPQKVVTGGGGGTGGGLGLTAANLRTARSNFLVANPDKTSTDFDALSDDDKFRWYKGGIEPEEGGDVEFYVNEIVSGDSTLLDDDGNVKWSSIPADIRADVANRIAEQPEEEETSSMGNFWEQTKDTASWLWGGLVNLF